MKKKRGRFFNFVRYCPLCTAVILSALTVSAYSLYGMRQGKYDDAVSFDRPILAAVFEQRHEWQNHIDDNLPDELEQQISMLPGLDLGLTAGADIAVQIAGSQPSGEDVTEPQTDSQAETQVETQAPYVKVDDTIKYAARQPSAPRSWYYDDPQKTALTTDYPYYVVDNSYFSDALFIGDSRMTGLCFYGGIDTADFCHKEGMNIYDIMTDTMNSASQEKIVLSEILKAKSYKKIYMMVGINELGRGTSEEFSQQYQKCISQIVRLQPDAKIIIFGIMNVTKEYSDNSDVFNNDNINSRNYRIAHIADGEKILYMDVNTVLCSDDGGLNASYTTDGIHLRAEYYRLWADFIRNHGV